MKATPQIVPVSELRNDYNGVLAMTKEMPVFLTKNGHAVGVLVSTEVWDRLSPRLEDLQDLVDVLEAQLAVARGEETFAPISEEELMALTTADEVPA